MKLFKFLKTQGPRVELREPSEGKKPKRERSKTTTRNPDYYQPRRLQPWEDFNLNTLQTMYDYILQEERDLEDPSQIRPSPDYALNEGGITKFTKSTNRKVVKDALKMTKESLGRHDFIKMVHGDDAEPIQRPRNKRGKTRQPWRPDWAGLRVGDDFEATDLTNVLPGDTKDSRCWKFNDLLGSVIPRDGVRELGKFERPPWIHPLRQVFTYCVDLEVRYGYVITDCELLVLRIRPIQEGMTPPENRADVANPKQAAPRASSRLQANAEHSGEPSQEKIEGRHIRNNGMMEFASIKVDSQKEDVLTVNLALWWLHLLAFNDNKVQPNYNALKEEALSRLERRLEEDGVATRAGNGEDNDGGVTHGHEEDDGTSRAGNGEDNDRGVAHGHEEDGGTAGAGSRHEDDAVSNTRRLPATKTKAQIKEWQQKAEMLSLPSLEALQPHLAELDAHLTDRSHIVGDSLTEADTTVWMTIRANHVAHVYVEEKLMVNLFDWFKYMEEAYSEQTTLAYRPATNGDLTTVDESDGPSHQQDPDGQISNSQADVHPQTVAEKQGYSSGKKRKKTSVDRGSKKQRK